MTHMSKKQLLFSSKPIEFSPTVWAGCGVGASRFVVYDHARKKVAAQRVFDHHLLPVNREP